MMPIYDTSNKGIHHTLTMGSMGEKVKRVDFIK